MKKITRLKFMKEVGRWGALAGLVGMGAVLLSRDDKVTCSDQCSQCPQFEHGKCGAGLK
ncbi:MAG: hypothetical protein JXR25_14730 [Pontiellaceae bacterium]|nr:hypothetical protein [Pontiellaceae bacterium]MBN2786075.1 hypothetical protein [Pontiellaceae bacterium]